MADPGFTNGGKDEEPQAPRGVGYGDGMSPFPLVEASGRGDPPPQKIVRFRISEWQL